MKIRVLAAASTLLLIALVAIGLAGCGGNDVPQGAIASVGDGVVTKKQFDKIMTQSKAQSEQEGQPAFPEKGTAEYKEFKARVVEYLVSQEVINQSAADPDKLEEALKQAAGIDDEELQKRWSEAAKEYKEQCDEVKEDDPEAPVCIQADNLTAAREGKPVDITDDQIDDQIAQLTEAYGGQEEVDKLLEQQAMTEKDLTQVIRDQLTGQAVYERVIAAAKVGDKQVKDYYEENQEQFDQPETRQVRHVLVEKKGEAQEVREELVADPSDANWKKVAKEYSIDPGSKDNGGELGDVTPGMMVPSFDEAAFSLEVDEISEPVESQFGWHVIEVTKITPALDSTLADHEDEIRQTLLSEKQATLWDSWLKQATTNADVKYAEGYDPKQLLEEAASPVPEETPAEDEAPVDGESPTEEAPEAEEAPETEQTPEASPSPEE